MYNDIDKQRATKKRKKRHRERLVELAREAGTASVVRSSEVTCVNVC
jgi:ribosomal protein L18